MPQESAPLPRDGCSAARPLFRATGTVLQPSTDDYGDAWEAFEHSRDLSSAFRVSWSVEGRGTPQISLSLLMQARTLGWVGFGLGETTGMQGADVVYYEKASNTLTDAYVTDTNAMPVADKCQDWTLVGSETSGSKLIVELSRKLVPADTAQDRGIAND